MQNAENLVIKTDSTFKYFLLTCLYLDFNATPMTEELLHSLFDDILYVCVIKIVSKIFREDKDLLATKILCQFC